MASSNTLEVIAQCFCKTHTFKTTVDKSSLPWKACACHCNSCRHATGALYSIDVPWPEPRENVDTSTLHQYNFSDNIAILFCGKCSTPMFFENRKQHTLGVFTGPLKNHDVDLVTIIDHIYVEDTIDGGATVWLKKCNTDGKDVKRYKQRDTGEDYPTEWPEHNSLTGYSTKPYKSVPFWCKCKGIDLLLHQDDYSTRSKDELPWFIDPEVRKPLAGFDPCDSCRLQSGIDLFHWTFTDVKNLDFPQGADGQVKRFNTSGELKAAVDSKDQAIGSLAYYESSEGVQRYFCKNCSATAFYAGEDQPYNIDVSIGLIEAPDGARAEGFCSWAIGGKMTYQEDADGGWREGFLQRVASEAEEWRISRDYPKNWRRVQRDKEAESS